MIEIQEYACRHQNHWKDTHKGYVTSIKHQNQNHPDKQRENKSESGETEMFCQT